MVLKTCFAMVITRNYFTMAMVALRSLRMNSGLDVPCYVFCTDKNDVPSRRHKGGIFDRNDYLAISGRLDELSVIYNNLIIQPVDTAKYKRLDKGWPGYWSHEIFNIKGYDRVIFSDADVICVGSLADLPETDLGMVYEVPRQQFFAGFISVGKKYFNTEIYEKILKHQKKVGTWGRDQAVYNEFFKKEEITELQRKYTVVTNSKCDDMRMLHFIFKPGPTSRLSPEYRKLWVTHASAVDKELKDAGVFRKPCK